MQTQTATFTRFFWILSVMTQVSVGVGCAGNRLDAAGDHGTAPVTTPTGSAGSTGSTGSAGNTNDASPPAGAGTPKPGNPYEGALMYVNPDYAHEVGDGGASAPTVAKAKTLATAVWLDRTEALAGGSGNGNRMSLAQHLDAAVTQSTAAHQPVVLTLVVYNLPDRDCQAGASNGELHGVAGLATYKSSFIDAIAVTLQSKPAYNDLRIAMIIEPDSLPNLVTNTAVPACAQVQSSGVYVDGITYAIEKFTSLANTSLYMDIAHSGWLGWPNNMLKAVPIYVQLLQSATHNHLEKIRGLATNISNYTPLVEPFINPNDAALLDGNFYQHNPIFDELSYVKALSSAFAAGGWQSIGFITDTSRNGWPKVNDGMPIDRRPSRGNWCNVRGAGLGVRPQANPPEYSGYDALVYVKPPGESDGYSAAPNASNQDGQGKEYDPACNPNNPALNALPGGPAAGAWFEADFSMLVQNATPTF